MKINNMNSNFNYNYSNNTQNFKSKLPSENAKAVIDIIENKAPKEALKNGIELIKKSSPSVDVEALEKISPSVDLKALKENVVDDSNPPAYLTLIANFIKKHALAPIEKHIVNSENDRIKHMINVGNCAKELVCMVVYPVQVLTNPDLPTDKKRFVGMYDFFVTCFSFGGAALYMWKGTKASEACARKFMKVFTKKDPNIQKKYPNAQRALSGAGFVLGLLVQNLFFKRVLAPALSPPLAGWSRRKLEERDVKKAQQAQGAEGIKKDDNLVPPQFDAALNKNKDNSIEAFTNKKSR